MFKITQKNHNEHTIQYYKNHYALIGFMFNVNVAVNFTLFDVYYIQSKC